MSGSRDIRWRQPGDSRRLAPPIRLPVIIKPAAATTPLRVLYLGRHHHHYNACVSLHNNMKKKLPDNNNILYALYIHILIK